MPDAGGGPLGLMNANCFGAKVPWSLLGALGIRAQLAKLLGQSAAENEI